MNIGEPQQTGLDALSQIDSVENERHWRKSGESEFAGCGLEGESTAASEGQQGAPVAELADELQFDRSETMKGHLQTTRDHSE